MKWQCTQDQRNCSRDSLKSPKAIKDCSASTMLRHRKKISYLSTPRCKSQWAKCCAKIMVCNDSFLLSRHRFGFTTRTLSLRGLLVILKTWNWQPQLYGSYTNRTIARFVREIQEKIALLEAQGELSGRFLES